MELIFHHAEVTIEVVAMPTDADAPEGAGAELGGYWLVVYETDAERQRSGNAFRVAIPTTTAELLVASWREHLEQAVRRTDDDPRLLELVGDDDPPADDDGVTPGVPLNRAERRALRYGIGSHAQLGRHVNPPGPGMRGSR